MIIQRAADADTFHADDFMTITSLLPAADSPMVSLVTGQLNGLHSARVNHRSAKLYLVIDGGLVATTNAEQSVLGPGDALLVKPGETLTLRGDKAVLAIVCAPAFDPADEQILT
jgi:mannose-6-phosphate isomerase-like protein (cupin superfamily)